MLVPAYPARLSRATVRGMKGRGSTQVAARSERRTARRSPDARAVTCALILVAAAVAVGWYLNRPGSSVVLWAPAAPLFGEWLPHLGPGSVFAVLIAFAVVGWGPGLAGRLPWRRLLPLGYLASLAWTFALAMVDGWHRGFADRLTDRNEYLHEVPGITDIPAMVRGFSARILDFRPDSWTTHVAGHPPGATLVFVWLDRIGLSGGAWAAFACVLVGGLVTVAVPVTLSALQRGGAARATVPFAVLFPGAVWVGVSADGLFAGLTATGVAVIALATYGFRAGRWYAVPVSALGGALLGFGVFLSYGLVLLGLIAFAVTLLGRSLTKALPLAVLGAVAVVAAFAVGGFWWLEGYHLVVERYYQGIGSARPYGYWVWANLASLVLAAGPALVAGVRRSCVALLEARLWQRGNRLEPVLVLVLVTVVVIALADLSGLSKAEVERIWLPFTVWLLPATSLLPPGTRRGWLAGQAVTALAVNHLVLTFW
jgi:methylthioxylose transferase